MENDKWKMDLGVPRLDTSAHFLYDSAALLLTFQGR
jgi:hypothetical protein